MVHFVEEIENLKLIGERFWFLGTYIYPWIFQSIYFYSFFKFTSISLESSNLYSTFTGGATRGGGPLGDLPPGAIAIATGNGRGGFPGLFQIAAGPGGGGGIPMMPLYGNPGDYAWGRGGFDSIVTQLLNQMDGTGPPPMSENNIKSIPTVKGRYNRLI